MNLANNSFRLEKVLGLFLSKINNSQNEIKNEELLLFNIKFLILFILFRTIDIRERTFYYKNNDISSEIDLLQFFSNAFCNARFKVNSKKSQKSEYLVISDIKSNADPFLIDIEIFNEFSQTAFSEATLTDELIQETYNQLLNLPSKSKTQKKLLGSFYTPMKVAKSLCKESISYFLISDKLENISILDSSCGTGNFLLSCFKILLNEHHSKGNNVTSKINLVTDLLKYKIFGFDIDYFAIIACKLRFYFYLKTKYENLIFQESEIRELFRNILNEDYLATSIDIKPTIIVGNPPWGKFKVSNDKKESLKDFKFQGGQLDNYRLFIEDLIKKKPQVLSLITPDTWFEIPGALLLREKFFSERTIKSIFVIPEEAFGVKVQFLGFLSIGSQFINEHYQLEIIDYEKDFTVSKKHRKDIDKSLINQYSLPKLVFLDNELLRLHRTITTNSTTINLGEVIEATIGYQLYHHTLHSKQEISEKVFHSSRKIDDSWIEEITTKNLQLLHITEQEKSFVKKDVKYFRIPKKKFFGGSKLLVREVLDKNGMIIAYSTKPVFFPKTIISIISKEAENDDKKLLIVMAFLLSYVCLFDFYINSVKGVKKYFPRISITSLKNIHFTTELLNSDLDHLIKKVLEYKKNKETKKLYSEFQYLIQARVFYIYKIPLNSAKMIMDYLKVPNQIQNQVLSKLEQL